MVDVDWRKLDTIFDFVSMDVASTLRPLDESC